MTSQIQRQNGNSKIKVFQSENIPVPYKIESASQLSKEIELVNSEVTGQIPVVSPALESGLDIPILVTGPL